MATMSASLALRGVRTPHAGTSSLGNLVLERPNTNPKCSLTALQTSSSA